jgi:hypothetical protein
VSGRIHSRAANRPAAQQPKVASHSAQASKVLILAGTLTPFALGPLVRLVRPRLTGQRYEIVTTHTTGA